MTWRVVLPLLILGVDRLLRGILGLPSQMLFYMLAVVIVALLVTAAWRWWPRRC